MYADNRQWRNVVFGSPRRLDLELRCTASRSVREMLAIWPDLPIIVADGGRPTVEGADNIISALELNDRVCRIHLENVSSPGGKICGSDAESNPRARIFVAWFVL